MKIPSYRIALIREGEINYTVSGINDTIEMVSHTDFSPVHVSYAVKRWRYPRIYYYYDIRRLNFQQNLF